MTLAIEEAPRLNAVSNAGVSQSLLLRGGVYSKARYPMVAAGGIFMVGLCLLTQSLWFWVAFLCLCVYYRFFVVQVEEDMLLSRRGIDWNQAAEDSNRKDLWVALSEDYEKYCERVKRWGIL